MQIDIKIGDTKVSLTPNCSYEDRGVQVTVITKYQVTEATAKCIARDLITAEPEDGADIQKLVVSGL